MKQSGMDQLLNELVDKLKKAYADRIVAIVLYGSAATGDHQPSYSDLNVLCVLTDVTPRELKDSNDIVRWWREQGSPAPLLLSEAEVRTSTDCFAIEFRDMQRHHRVLYGKDVISGLEIDHSFYRAQVEHDLRAKLLRLRQKAAGVLADDDLLRRLLADSISTFCVLFRHALVLSGVEGEMKKREVIAQAHNVFGIDPLPFNKILDVREEKLKPRDLAPLPLLESYLHGIGVVIDAVDRVPK
jgi:hypothetical protein